MDREEKRHEPWSMSSCVVSSGDNDRDGCRLGTRREATWYASSVVAPCQTVR
jgi:hypothetical protein